MKAPASGSLTKVARPTTSAGIWRVVGRGENHQEPPKLKKRIETPKGWVQYAAPDAPTVFDLRLFLALLRLADTEGKNLKPDTTAPRAVELRNSLDLIGDACDQATLTVSGSGRRLVEEMGLKICGQTLKAIKASLTRLSQISTAFEFQNNDGAIVGGGGSGILKFIYNGRNKDELAYRITLHPHLAAPLLGDFRQGYIALDSRDWRALSDIGLLVAVDLARICNPGQTKERLIDGIVRAVWPESGQAWAEWDRQKKVTSALKVINSLEGWNIQFDAQRRKIQVHRKKVESPPQA